MDHYQKPQDLDERPSSRFAAMRPDRKTLPRLFRNLKYFFLDSWFDIICILIIAGIAGAVWIIQAHPSLLFPLLAPDGTTYNPSISYPYREPIFSSLAAGLICGFIPAAIILFAQFWVRSFADCSSAILGLLYSLSSGTCFQVILKKSIGGLRPHFLTVCEPVIPEGVVGQGFNGIMYSVGQVCTGNQSDVNNALQSFPSGHTEVAFAGLGYLTIYLFTHLRIGDRDRSVKAGFWRMVAVLAPILLATYISCTLVLGYHHHAYDCFFGAAIGSLTALLGYRTAFRSITDSRTNWKPRVGRRLKRALESDATESDEHGHRDLEEGLTGGVGGGVHVNGNANGGEGDRARGIQLVNGDRRAPFRRGVRESLSDGDTENENEARN
ncbi:uncharacterized protein Z518_06256 [Rhinocladiella mackenziei CBS 650.93]|uniref:Rhinocladiella mackenziei CBS 650.93 unplaced genomic scaffold supercont1.4, whole genome shotgun sequence n=1 Tax=Rhinocladiella mackenziei CBS 650.93 TaxID=1442369 RepID=A0A0D2IHZ1_9EURO|nr:uncharacterized protein Z518_06256 [Rhinocladiella mackenziei CBS 650.93]KIX05384.1 hypothetical protein Z518_06256 [Rhinocladiella mackenziei CBS 650.93]